MFNPQRKNKVSDIFMQQKFYQMHISKMRDIAASTIPQKQRQRQQKQYQQHLNRLSMSKRQVNSRITNNIKQDNHKLFLKLLDTDNRKDDNNPEIDYIKNKKKHFNYYYSSKKELEKIKLENYTMVTRMMNSMSEVPTMEECKVQHRMNKKHQKRVRKLPSIFQHESAIREKLSRRYFKQDSVSKSKSRLGTSRISHLKLHESKIKEKQYQLLEKKSSKIRVHKDDKQSTAEQEEI